MKWDSDLEGQVGRMVVRHCKAIPRGGMTNGIAQLHQEDSQLKGAVLKMAQPQDA